MTKSFILSFFIVLLGLCATSCSRDAFVPGNDSPLSDYVKPIPEENVMHDSLWNIWCASMVEGYDGKFHLYYSRWPRKTHHESWISHSEIAYAVADKPEGPYKFQSVALERCDSDRWDGTMTHNPYIIKHKGKYYLYYIGTFGHKRSTEQILKPYGNDWWMLRNTQRIGVAVSDNPAGPWKRLDFPLLSNSKDESAFDAMLVSNPAVCCGRDGKFVMLYKGVSRNGTVRGGNVSFSVAFSDSPLGPFVKSGKRIFTSSDSDGFMLAEDPFIWYDKKSDMYFAVIRDVVRIFAGKDSGGLALMCSRDAIDWKPAKYAKVIPQNLRWSNGDTYDAGKKSFERPFIYFDKKGKPALLFGTFSEDKNGIRREHSFNGWIPFDINK